VNFVLDTNAVSETIQFIGAIARSRGFPVVTRDVAPFERMGCKALNPWQ
jgi:predicted nucleic acid-binding protein